MGRSNEIMKVILISPVIEMVVILSNNVSSEDPCPLKVIKLFKVSTFH